MTNADRRQALADLLRARRASLTPADVGLPPGPRRGSPSLRREEVAGLANISTAYYAYLEQARPVSPSSQVIRAVAEALQMTPAEADQLDELSRRQWSQEDPEGERPPEGVLDMVESLDPTPALVRGVCWDVLAANRAAVELFADWGGGDRNVVRWMFTDPMAREVYVEWETEARAMLGRFRAAFARHADLPAMRVLVESLQADSPEAQAWWSATPAAPRATRTQLLQHPRWGESRYRDVVLLIADEPDQSLISYSLAADDDTPTDTPPESM